MEKPFGWLKQIGPLKKVKLRGLAKVDWLFVFSCAVFNLIQYPETAGAERVNQRSRPSVCDRWPPSRIQNNQSVWLLE